MTNRFVVALVLLSQVVGFAQTAPSQWHHLDPAADKTIGISTERAYELLKTLPTSSQVQKPVIVAVIDGGVDSKHEDLQSAVPYHTQVFKPGTDQKVDFATLSKTGAIVNLYEAVKLAIAEQATAVKR